MLLEVLLEKPDTAAWPKPRQCTAVGLPLADHLTIGRRPPGRTRRPQPGEKCPPGRSAGKASQEGPTPRRRICATAVWQLPSCWLAAQVLVCEGYLRQFDFVSPKGIAFRHYGSHSVASRTL